MCISKYGYKDIVKLLINAGADINHKCDRDNWTALIFACEGKHKDTVKFLINSGAIIDKIWLDRIKQFYLKT